MILNKIIHRYVLKNFLKTFAITFFVSLFVLVMQFMFHYADDFIGKGAGLLPIIKLFFYSALSLVPLSLPLSILLGALMTFGNLGERLELLSMKAAGISLFRIMMPLIIFVAALSIGSFFFADKVLPVAQVKMWTLVFSIREKNPELNIPEGSFYSDIDGINMYVKEKRNGYMYDVVIYDLSNGFENMGIILADKGKLEMSSDKTYLLMTLYDGESFENMTEGGRKNHTSNQDIIPYRRESFSKKEIIIDFNSNFAEINSSFLEGQYVSKDTKALKHSLDSIQLKIDSAFLSNSKRQQQAYFESTTTQKITEETSNSGEPSIHKLDFYEIYSSLDSTKHLRVVEMAQARCQTIDNDVNYQKATTDWMKSEWRVHGIEWHKKFTLAFACFIFLFIGAPLGAIIRKGGMGMPIVISTILFIIYYIIDNTGYKIAREGIWDVWQGMWLSPSILLPIGVFLTYLAATDNTVLNGAFSMSDVKDFFKKLKQYINPKKYVQTKHN